MTIIADQLVTISDSTVHRGQVHLLVGWHAAMTDQQLTVARHERQRVPV